MKSIKSHTIRINSECNQKCVFCFADWDEEISKEKFTNIITTDYKKEISDLFERGYRGICISGGEPTLNKNILDIIRTAKKTGFKRIELQTNSALLNKNKVALLKKAGITNALVSFHSHIPEKFDAITNTKGGFERAVAGINNILDIGIPTTVVHVICSLNYADLAKFPVFIASKLRRIDEILFFYVQPEGRAKEGINLMPRLTDLKEEWHDALKRCDELNIKFRIDSQSGIPLCYMAGYEDRMNFIDIKNPKEVFGDDTSSFEYIQGKKIKVKKCKDCFFDNACYGFWKEYVDIYGDGEFIPVKADKKLISKFR